MVRKLIEAGLRADDVSVLTELVAEQEVVDEWKAKFQAFPDLRMQPDTMIGEGDEVWTQGVFIGTHTGDCSTYSATGRRVELRYMDRWTIREGKVVDNSGIWGARPLLAPQQG